MQRLLTGKIRVKVDNDEKGCECSPFYYFHILCDKENAFIK